MKAVVVGTILALTAGLIAFVVYATQVELIYDNQANRECSEHGGAMVEPHWLSGEFCSWEEP